MHILFFYNANELYTHTTSRQNQQIENKLAHFVNIKIQLKQIY